MQRLLVSVRGPIEALSAARGGAHIADVEFPSSALGTPYPLNIAAVRRCLRSKYPRVAISTNIGETPQVRANACQAALGVATAGAELIKFGLAELPLRAAVYQGREVVRTVRAWYPRARLYAAVFVDTDLQRYFDVLKDSVTLAAQIKADGVLIDTYEKGSGQGLLDHASVREIAALVRKLHSLRKEAWLAGSIVKRELADLWSAGPDVICVRGAACEKQGEAGRFGAISSSLVRELVATIPRR